MRLAGCFGAASLLQERVLMIPSPGFPYADEWPLSRAKSVTAVSSSAAPKRRFCFRIIRKITINLSVIKIGEREDVATVDSFNHRKDAVYNLGHAKVFFFAGEGTYRGPFPFFFFEVFFLNSSKLDL